jgi:hypothetical protein
LLPPNTRREGAIPNTKNNPYSSAASINHAHAPSSSSLPLPSQPASRACMVDLRRAPLFS